MQTLVYESQYRYQNLKAVVNEAQREGHLYSSSSRTRVVKEREFQERERARREPHGEGHRDGRRFADRVE